MSNGHRPIITQSILALSELSQRDYLWDKYKATASIVSEFYANTEFQKYAISIDACSDFLCFRLVNDDCKQLKFKLKSAMFCRVRYCPVCQWRRSLMWKAKAYSLLVSLETLYPTCRWLFLTLTVKNPSIEKLRVCIKHMSESFSRLSRLKDFPAIGWLRSLEITCGVERSPNPHLHCLLLVKPWYFGRGYLTHDEWRKNWQKSLCVDYQPMVNIQAVSESTSMSSAISELFKYCVKNSDITANREWLLELTRQTTKLKTISTGGVLKKHLSELEREPEDLIGDYDGLSGDNGLLRFRWDKLAGKYYLAD